MKVLLCIRLRVHRTTVSYRSTYIALCWTFRTSPCPSNYPTDKSLPPDFQIYALHDLSTPAQPCPDRARADKIKAADSRCPAGQLIKSLSLTMLYLLGIVAC